MSQPSIGVQCWDCKHIHADYTCEAFPRGIPAVIVLGNPHTRAVFGDKGIRFERRPEGEEAPAFISLLTAREAWSE